MTSTLHPACPLCGLRFASKPLLELHIREDHRPRRAQPSHDDAGDIQPPSAAAGSASVPPGLVSRPSRTVKEVTVMTAARSLRREQVMTVPRRVIRALWQVHDELMRASEAIVRSARAAQPRRRAQTPTVGELHPCTAGDRADRAA